MTEEIYTPKSRSDVFRFNDVVEFLFTLLPEEDRIGRLVQVRKGCGIRSKSGVNLEQDTKTNNKSVVSSGHLPRAGFASRLATRAPTGVPDNCTAEVCLGVLCNTTLLQSAGVAVRVGRCAGHELQRDRDTGEGCQEC